MVECKHCRQLTMFEVVGGKCAARPGKDCEYALYTVLQLGDGQVHVIDQDHDNTRALCSHPDDVGTYGYVGVYTIDIYGEREKEVTCSLCYLGMRQRHGAPNSDRAA